LLSSHEAEPGGRPAHGLGSFALRAGSLVQGDASEGIIAEVGFDLLDPQRLNLKAGQVQVDGCILLVRSLRRGIGSQDHGNVNVFEDPAGSDAQDSVTGFHQVVPFTAAVLPSEMVGEGKTGIELFGFDKESGAVRFPFNGFHGALTRRVLLVTCPQSEMRLGRTDFLL